MDILVTTPKSEHETAKMEGEALADGNGFWFRVFPRRPDVQRGDKVYFVDGGVIRGYGVVFCDVEQLEEPEECDLTGRIWGHRGSWCVRYHEWQWLPLPVPFKGFQGFRYVSRIPGLQEKLRQGPGRALVAVDKALGGALSVGMKAVLGSHAGS